MKATDRQIGGEHYKLMQIQPINFILANRLGFAEGNIIKYISRYKSKNGIEDLEKAKHYIDLLIESQKAEDVNSDSYPKVEYINGDTIVTHRNGAVIGERNMTPTTEWSPSPDDEVKCIYISGKISGMEDEAKILFAKAEEKLLDEGYRVMNPFNLDSNHDKSWEAYMKECIKALCGCTDIYMLKNWHESRGAKMEYHIALTLGIEAHYE